MFPDMVYRILTAAMIVFVPAGAVAQSECIANLIQDTAVINLQESSSLATAELYRRSRSEKENWAAGITVPIKGIPVEGNLTYAQEEVENYFKQSNLNWTEERLTSVATQTLSANAVAAYRICKDGEHRSGPRIIVHDATREEAAITVRWLSPPDAPTTVQNAVIEVVNGTLSQPFSTSWTTGMSETRIVSRDPDADLRITSNIGKEGASAFVSRLPPPREKRPVLLIGSCIGKGGQDGVRLWGPAGELCNGLPLSSNWGRYDAQVQPITQVGSCIGHGGFEGVRLYGPPGKPCGGMLNNAWGVYANPVDVSQVGLANCHGNGNILAGHLLWGPYGADCGGFKGWGLYSEGRVTYTAMQ